MFTSVEVTRFIAMSAHCLVLLLGFNHLHLGHFCFSYLHFKFRPPSLSRELASRSSLRARVHTYLRCCSRILPEMHFELPGMLLRSRLLGATFPLRVVDLTCVFEAHIESLDSSLVSSSLSSLLRTSLRKAATFTITFGNTVMNFQPSSHCAIVALPRGFEQCWILLRESAR